MRILSVPRVLGADDVIAAICKPLAVHALRLLQRPFGCSGAIHHRAVQQVTVNWRVADTVQGNIHQPVVEEVRTGRLVPREIISARIK